MFAFLVCATLAVLLPHSGPGVQQTAADRMVDAGSHRLHFRIIRGQGPVILLEAGGGLTAKQWDSLLPKIAATTGATVLAYDRPGLGESEPAPGAYDIRQEVADLWRALETLGLAKSLLLVGHSYGGFIIQLLAHDHPDAVTGCLFIDPNNAEFVDAIGGPDALMKESAGQLANPVTKEQQALARVLSVFPETITIMRTAPVPKTIAVRVITAGKQWWPTAERNRAFRESHEHLAASVPGGRLIVAERSSHNIPRDQPELVVEVIQEMLRLRR